jgi:hypothetical protein
MSHILASLPFIYSFEIDQYQSPGELEHAQNINNV